MKEHSYLITGAAEEATHTYCKTTDCESCKYLFCGHTCSKKCQAEIALKIVTALAIKEVKEIVNESKD